MINNFFVAHFFPSSSSLFSLSFFLVQPNLFLLVPPSKSLCLVAELPRYVSFCHPGIQFKLGYIHIYISYTWVAQIVCHLFNQLILEQQRITWNEKWKLWKVWGRPWCQVLPFHASGMPPQLQLGSVEHGGQAVYLPQRKDTILKTFSDKTESGAFIHSDS